jgi:hypothetical protein
MHVQGDAIIPVKRMVDMKGIIGKMEGRGGEAQGVAAPPLKLPN